MGSLQETNFDPHDHLNGEENSAFEHEDKHDTDTLTKKTSGHVDLVSSLVLPSPKASTPSTLNPPLDEISLNGNSLKRMTTLDIINYPDEKSKDYPDSLNDYDDDADADMRCSLGCFSPEWIQRFATKKVFLIIFSLLGLVQGATWSYFTATISTMERRFQISSQTAGIVMTGNEISQILFSVFIAYFGGKGHRPRWIAVGVLLSAVSCFLLASPQAFYGSGDDMLALTEEYGHLYESSHYQRYVQTTPSPLNLDIPMSSTENFILSGPMTITPSRPSPSLNPIKRGRVSVCQRNEGSAYRQGNGQVCDGSSASMSSYAPLLIIFFSQFVAGIGNLLFFSLGGPYLDDNTTRNNMPKVLGATMSLRLVGPMLGFLTASATLKMFVNPLLTPVISPDDPRWQGAWWLGWMIFGTLMIIMSVFIALFPRRLRRKNQKSIDPDEINASQSPPNIAEIPLAVKRLLKNKVNLFNNLAGVFYLFSAIGYWTYMPKYLETIYLQTASNASIISGAVGILCQSSGMMISGILISKYQPSARKLALWNVLVAFVTVVVMASFTQLGCNVGNIAFGSQNPLDRTWNLTSECNAECNCRTSKILPVCVKETNTLYYSACHAGCTVYENNTLSNCKCVPGSEEGDVTVTVGNCSEGCSKIFILFLGIGALIKFFDATGRIGNMLISYRCVELKDRSLSIGLNILMISLFAFLPSPILFGRIIDNVCLVWGGSTCGEKQGNCMFYDGERFRYIFNLTAAAFTLIGGLLDCLVLYYVKDMELYREPCVENDGSCTTTSSNSCSNDHVNENLNAAIPKNNNNSSDDDTTTKGGAVKIDGGGGFVNLSFNNEKSEQ